MHTHDLTTWLTGNGFELDETSALFFRDTADGVTVQVKVDGSVTWVDRFTDDARILDWSAELRDAPAHVERAVIREALGERPPTMSHISHYGSAEAAAIRRAVAATYRQQAEWTDDPVASARFSDLAGQVEAVDDEDCCPCCREITCDPGCPLEPVRGDVLSPPSREDRADRQ